MLLLISVQDWLYQLRVQESLGRSFLWSQLSVEASLQGMTVNYLACCTAWKREVIHLVGVGLLLIQGGNFCVEILLLWFHRTWEYAREW